MNEQKEKKIIVLTSQVIPVTLSFTLYSIMFFKKWLLLKIKQKNEIKRVCFIKA
jgi:hypothetical protein